MYILYDYPYQQYINKDSLCLTIKNKHFDEHTRDTSMIVENKYS